MVQMSATAKMCIVRLRVQVCPGYQDIPAPRVTGCRPTALNLVDCVYQIARVQILHRVMMRLLLAVLGWSVWECATATLVL